MPIYEFYCERCNTIFNFFSRRIDTETIPFCPSCKKVKLKRQMSVFSTMSAGRRNEEEGPDGEAPALDEARMERAMEMLARETEGLDEEDPRVAARLLKKVAESTGLDLNPEMAEALDRVARGEDPEKIEEELGDLLTDDNPFATESGGRKGRTKKPGPKVDETLYDLPDSPDS